MSKKVTLFIDSLRAGGAERVCVNLANSLVEKGIPVTILVMNFAQYGTSYHLSEKVEVFDLKVSNARYVFMPLLKYFYMNRFGTLICFNYELTIISVLLRMLCPGISFKLITRNINSLEKMFKLDNSLFRKYIVFPLLKWSYTNCDLIVNQCKGMRDEVNHLIPKAKGKSIYIYNIVSDEVQSIAENVVNSSLIKENYLLYVGRLEPQKGLQDLILAFYQVSKANSELKLKVVGTGRLLSDLQSLVSELELEDRVEFEGFQKNVIEYYKKAKAVVLTSRFEGFPNVLVEAVSLGTPVIAYDCSHGPNEIINDLNGYLVEMDNIDKFAESINTLVDKDFDHHLIHLQASKKYFKDAVLHKWLGVI